MTESIISTPGRDLDLSAMLRSVDQWTWMRMGVHANGSGWVYGQSYAQHRLPGRPGMKLIIKLAENDTYSIEIGRLRKMNWVVLGQRHGVYADDLGSAVDALYQAV